jgi:hypothetical protein
MHSGAIEASNRATVGDAAFALSHAARAHALLECGDTPAAREAMAAAAARAFRLPAHEAGHMAYFGLLVAGDTTSALHAHLDI